MGLFSTSKSTVSVTQIQSVAYEPKITSTVSYNVLPTKEAPAASSTGLSFGGSSAPVLDLSSQFPATQASAAGKPSEFGTTDLLFYLAIGAVLLYAALRS